MKESGTEELFELVRKAPTELSHDKVMEIIRVLPTLPPPTNSWFNINLNSIIMTTTVVTIITSAVIYFSAPGDAPELPGQEPVETQTNTPTLVPEEKPITETSDSTHLIQALPQTEEPAAKTVTATQEKSSGQEKESEQPASTAQKPAKIAIPAQAQPQPIVEEEKREQAGIPAPALTPVPDSGNKTSETAEMAKEEATSTAGYMVIDDLRLKRLKRTLLRELAGDKLIKSKRRYNVLEFKEGEIFINNQRMDYEQYTRYSELLYKFRVEPASDMRVVTSLRSIMVGRFTDAGFLGSAQGRDMDIDFIENEIEGLLSPGTNSTDRDRLFSQNEVETENDRKLISNSKGSGTSTGSTGLLNSNQRSSTSQGNLVGSGIEVNSASETAEQNDNTVDLDSKQIKAFKKELYRQLVADDQIASKRADVVMRIGLEPFSVNNNRPMQGDMLKGYETLLKKYDIEPAEDRKILMSLDFIMVGDFEKHQFSGSLQGRIDQSTTAGSLFQQELEGYSIFNAKTAVDIDLDTDPDIDVDLDLDHDVDTDVDVDVDPDIDVDVDPDIDIDVDAEAAYLFKKEEREIAPFQKLEVSGLAVVYFTYGPHTKASLKVGGMPVEDVITRSENGVLRVSTRKDNISGESIQVHVSSPNITSIKVDGAGEIFGQNPIRSENLKVISNGSGALELAVDVDRLHLEMNGGDIDIEGKAKMEKVDFLRRSATGTLDQAGLEISNNWTEEGDDTWEQKGLEPLKEVLMNKLLRDRFVENRREGASIRFFDDLIEIGRYRLRGDELKEYLNLFQKYGIGLRNERNIYVSHDFLIVADRDNGVFQLHIQGTDLNFNVEDSWGELKESILGDY